MKKLAPILLFTYNRLYETRETVKALQKNYLATESELFVFSDGAKDSIGEEKVNKVRDYLKTISGFKRVHIKEAKINQGLAKSVVNGVTEIIDQYNKVIVLEDDLITSPNFLDFMNQALDFYSGFPKVISISGYTLDLPALKNYPNDFYIGYRASSWGWGTWKDKWENIDWEVSDYVEFKDNRKERLEFGKIGSDMPRMLKNQMDGKIDSWAIRWCYHQFKHRLVTIFPAKSKIKNIGIGEEATHTTIGTRFETPLDVGDSRIFGFDKVLVGDDNVIKDFRSRFSVKMRVLDRLRKYLRLKI
ncbi:MAG: sugar transferase [Maribacter sp.]|nr:MAG: sugar transferase [Maribacter sp.]